MWTDESCKGLRSRLQNPCGEAAVKPLAKTATTGELVHVEMEFGDRKKPVFARPTMGSVVAARGTRCMYVQALKEGNPNSLDILQIANGGTPILLLGRGTIL